MRTFIILTIIFLLLSTTVLAAYGPPTGTRASNQQPTEQPKEKNDCKDQATMQERIRCRIQLPKEKKYDYLPEECRALGGGTAGATCIKRYQQLQPCFTIKNYQAQLSCGRKTLHWGTTSIQDEVHLCKAADNPTTCLQTLTEKTYDLIIFRIYMLEQQLQLWYDQGLISEQQTTATINTFETAKQQFRQAPTIAIKKAVLQQTQTIWKQLQQETHP